MQILVDEAQRLDGRRDAAAHAHRRGRATVHRVAASARRNVPRRRPVPERHVLADDGAGAVEPRLQGHHARLLVVVVGRGGACAANRRRRHGRMMMGGAKEASPRRRLLLVGGGGLRRRQVEREARGRCRRGHGHGGRGARALVLAASPADGHVAERAALGPVPAARLAEVARLRQAVVVVVAELGVGGVAARAPQPLLGRRGRLLLRLRRRAPAGSCTAGAALPCPDSVVPRRRCRRRRHIYYVPGASQQAEAN